MKRNEPLSKHTTFKIGGPAKYFVEVQTEKELLSALGFAREKKLKTFFLGKGSNVLFSDKGFPGLVIKPVFSRITIKGEIMTAEAGASLHKIVNEAMNHSLAGLEAVIGIPGSVGGAIAMNAGVGKSAIGDRVVRVWAVDKSQKSKVKSQKECKFGYRKSIFQKDKYFIIKVELKLKKGDKADIRNTIKEMWQKRLAKQPYDMPSAGSFFKNPKSKFAAQLIDEAGLKGMRVGDAEVSTKHGNFIVNRGKARALDVLKLAKKMQQKVMRKFGVKLEPEVKVI
ncbi:UDP-N-acetylmuramate dehydrogenase [Candidatus Saganbacteria bacterium]|nr:UDP-N-acetylmuramate dehydrogenase [Candidatus Saganbacteria bacterium]